MAPYLGLLRKHLPDACLIYDAHNAEYALQKRIASQDVRIPKRWPAAAMVFTMFVAGIVDTMSRGMPPGIIAVAAAAVLLSNVRAAFLASEWRPAGPDEDRPTRFNETFSDKLVDQMPAKLWPVLKVPFFIIASLYLLLIFAGFTIQIIHHFGGNLTI